MAAASAGGEMIAAEAMVVASSTWQLLQRKSSSADRILHAVHNVAQGPGQAGAYACIDQDWAGAGATLSGKLAGGAFRWTDTAGCVWNTRLVAAGGAEAVDQAGQGQDPWNPTNAGVD